MNRIFQGILMFLILTGVAFAVPSPIARFKFEDAEAAFAKQEYQTTLAKLDEAEKEFGKLNPPILYLRIMARYELLKQNPQDFKAVEQLRRETAHYLKEYGGIESLRDKAREVYRISSEHDAELKQIRQQSAAWVNGIPIHRLRIQVRVQALTADGQLDTPALRKGILDDLINLELLAQEAVESGIGVKVQVDGSAIHTDAGQQSILTQQSTLARAWLRDYASKHPITEEQLRQEYHGLKVKLGGKEYIPRHILVATEAEAQDIVVQLGKKADFESLAVKSIDPGSAQHGGSLGWTVPGNFVPEFGNALRSLKKGEYTKVPVRTEFGWHVIKLDDVRDLKLPAYEEVKPQLQQSLQKQLTKKAINELRIKARIKTSE